MSKYELVVRDLKENDYETLCEWWRWWRWVPVVKEALPDNGTGGFMVEHNGIEVCAGFLYSTNSNICMIEWTISNYKVKNKNIRKEALQTLIQSLSEKAKKLGFKLIFTFLVNENLKQKFENQGFMYSNKPIEMIKTI